MSKFAFDSFQNIPFKNAAGTGITVFFSIPKDRRFVRDYAVSGEEEDFAEMFGFLFDYPSMIGIQVPER